MPRRLPAFVGALSVLGMGLALGGCAVGPTFKRPDVTLSEAWRETGDPRVAAQAAVDRLWWKTFHDATLDRLVELAYQQNLPLQIAGLRIVEARALLGIATGKQFPQLQVATGSVTAAGLSSHAPNVAQLPTKHFVDYQVGFDAAWELDFWGKYRRGVEAQGASLFASVADYYSAIVSLTAEVARTYVAIRTLEVLIEQTRENARVQEEGLRIAESRFRNGVSSELDPSQARTLLESTRATIPQLQISLQQARNALSTLLGQPTGTVDALLDGPKEIPKAPPQVAVSVPAEMLRRRPDVRSAELSAAAQCARIGVAKADLYPSFSLFGSIGLQTSTSGTASYAFFSGDSLYYSAGPRVVWPFFNYGRIKNSVRVEDARFQQLLVGYRYTVLRAAQEVEDALTGFLSSEEAATFQEASVTAARRSVDIAVVQYREGAVDYQRVLDAQRSLLQQQIASSQTSSSVVTNLIALYKALGGGWESREGERIVPPRMQDEMRERTDWGDLLSQPLGPGTTQTAAPAKQ